MTIKDIARLAGCGVATLSISYYELGQITGEMAVQILTGQADISEMEIQYASVTKMYNAANCETLNLTMPGGGGRGAPCAPASPGRSGGSTGSC